MSQLKNVLVFLTMAWLKDRQPLNAYAAGAVPGDAKGEYKCDTHNKVDCVKCFDWVRIIKEEARTVEEEGRWLAARNKWMDRVDIQSKVIAVQ